MNVSYYRKRAKLIVNVVLIMAIVFSSIEYNNVYTYAANAKMNISANIVCGQNEVVSVRSGPGISYDVMHRLANAKPITIIEQTQSDNGQIWYKIKYNLIATGEECVSYVLSDYVTKSDSQEQNVSSVAYKASGSVNANNVSVRNKAGTKGTTILIALYIGDSVNISEKTDIDGDTWYHVTCEKNSKTYDGWIFGKYITIKAAVKIDKDYAKTLKNAGFPDSYINDLCVLHAEHPKWEFEAINTGLDWETVIAKENRNGLNLVPISSDDSRKSTAEHAYDWKTNKWTIYDGSSWVGASTEYLSYCMDPRNFLIEPYIFQFESLSYDKSQNIAGIKSIVKGSFMEKSVVDTDKTTLVYDQAFLDIGANKNVLVSPYHLAARVKQEQGTRGKSSLISGTYAGYEGYFNYFNFGAYGATSAAVIKAGLTYAKKQGWNTRYKALYGGAQMIGKNYISRGQNTLYFQKFNVVYKDSLYSHQYMGNVSAAISESKTVAAGYADKEQAFVFKIPVYKNMPSKAVSFVDKGNPNNYLKSLSISGVSITPSFNGSNTSYSAVAGSDISSVTVSATSVVAKSKITGTGTVKLSAGDNLIKVKCKSESGDTRTYTIKIYKEGIDEPEANYEIKSKKYHVDKMISGISPNTSVSTFLKKLSVADGTIKVLKSNGKENTGKVGTGNRVVVLDADGMERLSYDIVIYGDMNGDGMINALDMIKLNRHILGISKLKGAALKAADVNRKSDGVNALDMIALNRHTIGLSSIKQ